MKTASAKAKGRSLAKKVATWLVNLGGLATQDVHATNSGVTGADITFSAAATRLWPFAIECKKHAAFAVYAHYDQAVAHAGATGLVPIAIIEANRRKPLVVVDAEWFFEQYQRGRAHGA